MLTQPIQIVQGGQYGSEAKGAVAAHLCLEDKIDFAVRTGATNAGHTVWYQGKRYVMQQLPVGWVRPETRLVIGAGALVDPVVLMNEIRMVTEATGEDVRDRLYIDHRAYLHWSRHAKQSADSGRHFLMGATGKGCSEALISRLRGRGLDDHRIGANPHDSGLDIDRCLGDTEAILNRVLDEGARIQLEGTQGQLLDLVLGPYPYTTHKQTGPAQWLLEAGLSPNLPLDIVMVIRTMPIRVAGNSGPLPGETSWPTLARRINQQHPMVPEDAIVEFEEAVRMSASDIKDGLPAGSDGLDQHLWSDNDRLRYREALSTLNAMAIHRLPESTVSRLGRLFEFTTVTRKLRRIAALDRPSLAMSARQIRPSRVVVTFMNYAFPALWHSTLPVRSDERAYLEGIERVCDAPVVWINRGPLPEHFIEV